MAIGRHLYRQGLVRALVMVLLQEGVEARPIDAVSHVHLQPSVLGNQIERRLPESASKHRIAWFEPMTTLGASPL